MAWMPAYIYKPPYILYDFDGYNGVLDTQTTQWHVARFPSHMYYWKMVVEIYAGWKYLPLKDGYGIEMRQVVGHVAASVATVYL
jgi:hypothetical protein